MRLPQVPEPQTSILTTSVWLGYNHNLRIQQGELYDMKNMSLDSYPVLTTRKARGTVRPSGSGQSAVSAIAHPNALIAKEQLAWVDGNKLYYAGGPVMDLYPYTNVDKDRILVSMGSYIIVFPDGKYYNTLDSDDKGDINATFSVYDLSEQSVMYSICDGTFADITPTVSASEPQNPANGDYWINTASVPNTLMQYSSYSAQWATVPTTYVKISCPGIGANFSAGDGVSISGCAYTGSGEMALILRDQIDALNGDVVLKYVDTNYIVVIGLLSQNYEQQSGEFYLKREAPSMDFVVESNNRLWGCKFGMVGDEVRNELYACKLGDFKNWRVYEGASTDSYAVSVGSDGPFTGAITYKNLPHFFKESCVYQVYGTMPSSYQIVHTKVPGVKDGSPRSLVSEGGYLFYKSPAGICQYDGSNARYISQALGPLVKETDGASLNATAGAFGGKLYVDVQGFTEQTTPGGLITVHNEIFVYDITKGVWCHENGALVYFWASTEYDLFFIDHSGNLICVNGTEGAKETFSANDANEHSEIVSAPIGYEDPNQKYLTRFNIRLALTSGAKADLYLMYDSSKTWAKQGGTYTATSWERGTIMIPVTPHRCDHVQWKLVVSGGEVELYSVSKTYESGSDVV